MPGHLLFVSAFWDADMQRCSYLKDDVTQSTWIHFRISFIRGLKGLYCNCCKVGEKKTSLLLFSFKVCVEATFMKRNALDFILFYEPFLVHLTLGERGSGEEA